MATGVRPACIGARVCPAVPLRRVGFHDRVRSARFVTVAAELAAGVVLTDDKNLNVNAQPEGQALPLETKVTSAVVDDDNVKRKKLWMAAIKPPMYSVGFIPVLVGGAAVFAELGMVPWSRCLGFVLAAISVIAWLNLSNDAFDAATGVDRTKPESIVNLTGNRGLVLAAANTFLLVGLTSLTYLLTATGDLRAAGMLAVAIVCGYVYQGPPFRLSYKGMGEPLCFVAFGLMATPAFYLALQPTPAVAAGAAAVAAAAAVAPITPLVWTLGVLVGITTTVILFCSHFHQIEGDKAAGKRSPLVRLGIPRAMQVLRVSLLVPYLLAVGGCAAGLMPATTLLGLALSVPSALGVWKYAVAHQNNVATLAFLKRFATKWHIVFGLCLVLGLMASRFPLMA